MEAGEVTGKNSSSKSKKKGGKGAEAISAAREARRREAIKEALRQKLELERRALNVVERLVEEDSVTDQFLIDCAWYITSINYKDTVEERSIAKLCGYPVCPNKLTNVPAQQFKISTKTNKVYDITERKCFCCNFCYKASKCFEFQISKTPLWLRKDERPPEIKLMKEGDGGSSGQEIKLVDKPLKKADIENPVTDVPESYKDSPPFSQSDNSDIEQDFVSSVVSRQSKQARVHWGKLPKRDGASEDESTAEIQQCEHPEPSQRENNDGSGSSQTQDPTDCLPKLDKTTSAESDIKDTLELLNRCSLKDAATNLPEIVNSLPAAGALNITQVGMSKRGAAGLKGLLKDHNRAKTTPTAVNLCLLERLRQTFTEWRTEETMKFLYGPGYVSGTEVTAQEAEELDEDDLDETEVELGLRPDSGSSFTPRAPAPDIETLRKETASLELRVREFYEGVCVLPGELKTDAIKETEDKQDSGKDKDPPLPLVDSHAQHLIQKRIVVEKLSRSLRDVVGPLCLTISDVINDINNLVRTFRFTNKNIIHKSPEWTLIAVVLLSVLTEVSPLLKESLESPSSLEYITSLMSELKLEDKDLHNLVLLFKPCVAPITMYSTHM
ncbi:putative RNA polymerase II subunit B1 CTD phosphatase rpap2 [Pimephales promelas]|uniref:putative RNA polymerase II subunit B1 CTD phosphatase rpap2 n=1 Tax=Pimephales promelas TaxID=90988 RepID=UPI001955DC64|nr:putative RNA polymerase II subunit B1 CTD phosphatase rpap2 [Pimephales promelas]KAG1969245.1 putative RNA polymerase II subunit B1 CTD phosphatase RPAP2 [Pimephales promelas]